MAIFLARCSNARADKSTRALLLVSLFWKTSSVTLAAAGTFGWLTVDGVGRVHAIARPFYGRFHLIRRRKPLVVLHSGFACRDRHLYVADAGDRLQRARDIAGAAAASHPRHLQKLRLHCCHFQRCKATRQRPMQLQVGCGRRLGVRHTYRERPGWTAAKSAILRRKWARGGIWIFAFP